MPVTSQMEPSIGPTAFSITVTEAWRFESEGHGWIILLKWRQVTAPEVRVNGEITKPGSCSVGFSASTAVDTRKGDSLAAVRAWPHAKTHNTPATVASGMDAIEAERAKYAKRDRDVSPTSRTNSTAVPVSSADAWAQAHAALKNVKITRSEGR